MHRFSQSFALLALALIGFAAAAQDPQTGRLLVASPSLDDLNFAETVLLLIRHDDMGSLAIALNRPTWVDPVETFPDSESVTGYRDRLFFGGPVAPSQLLVLFEAVDPDLDFARHVLGTVFISDQLSLLETMDLAADDGPKVRLYAGHAAWQPGQLEDEIARGGWRVLPANLDQIFSADPEGLWRSLAVSGDGITAGLR